MVSNIVQVAHIDSCFCFCYCAILLYTNYMSSKTFCIWSMTKSVEKGANRQALTQIWILTHKVYSLYFWGHFDCSWGLSYCLDGSKSLFRLIRGLKIPEILLKEKNRYFSRPAIPVKILPFVQSILKGLLSWSELDSAIIRSIKNKLRVGVEWSALNIRI